MYNNKLIFLNLTYLNSNGGKMQNLAIKNEQTKLKPFIFFFSHDGFFVHFLKEPFFRFVEAINLIPLFFPCRFYFFNGQRYN